MTTETTDRDGRGSAFDPVAAMLLHIEAGDQLGALTLARELHPAQLADAFAGIDHEVSELLVQRLAPRELGAALAYLEPHYREDLLAGFAPERIAQVLDMVDDDVATDVVQELPKEIGEQVLAALSERQQHAIDHLMSHGEESAGGRMTGQRIAMPPDRLAGEERPGLGASDRGEAARLVQVRGDLGQEFVVAETDRNGDGELVLHPECEPRQGLGGAPPVQGLRARQVHERLVDGERLNLRREIQHHRPDLAADGGVLLHVGLDDGRLGAGLQSLEHRHGRMHAVGAREIAARGDHTPVTAADDHGDVAKLRAVALLDRGVEGVAVEMGDGELV